MGFRKGRSVNANRKRTQQSLQYEPLELRKVLSAYLPAYIDGQLNLGDPDSAAPYPLSETFNLSSNPNATKTIYLDFNGHLSSNDGWGHNINFPAYNRSGSSNSFNNAELIDIQLQFQNVAEDFLPFDVNVTTRDPGVEALRRTSFADQRYGVRAVISQPTDGFGDSFGGIAFLNSFTSSSDTPVFVFNKGINAGAQTISHEVGHALGLFHDGLGSREYHPGTGSGTTSWGPLLGAPFSANVTQFSNGDYAGSTNNQDDLAVITSNGFGYRADDYGNSIASANGLTINNNRIFDWGVVERNTDRDFLRFETGNGRLQIDVNAFDGNPNLDILARLYDANGNVVATSNPSSDVNASFNLNVAAGTYYLAIEGTGLSGVYSDYGSLGFYSIEGTVQTATSSNEIGEVGRVTGLNHNWKTVTLSNNYTNPVIVAGPASRVGGDRLTVRVRNVTSNSFQIQLDEYEYRDGRHNFETVDFIVVEAGTHQLADGTTIVAGTQNQNHQWQTYTLGGAFSSPPVVLSQITTTNDPVAATTRTRNVGTNGFQLRIQEEQAANQAHGIEQVSWIAIEQGQGQTDGNRFEAFATPHEVQQRDYQLNFNTNFSSRPAFIAGMQTFNGSDTATVRYKTLTQNGSQIFVEEEKSFDNEVQHVPESVGYFAMELGPIVAADANRISSNNSSVVDNNQNNVTSQPPIFFFDFDGLFGHRGELVDGDLSADLAHLESLPEVAMELAHDPHEDHSHDSDDHHDEDHDEHEHELEEAENDIARRERRRFRFRWLHANRSTNLFASLDQFFERFWG